MPYRLTGATQPCEQGLDKVVKDCKDCVDKIVLSFMIACSPTLLTFNVSLVGFKQQVLSCVGQNVHLAIALYPISV